MRDSRTHRVWALSDGIPGHLSHSRGLIGAVRRLAPVRVEWIDVSLRWAFARRLLRYLINQRRDRLAGSLAGHVYRYRVPDDRPPDLILSSGGRTSFLNAVLARHHGCPNLFAGTLRGLTETAFTAHVTPFPVAGAKRNLVVPVPLTDLDRAEAEREGDHLRRELGLGDEELWCLLAGGAAPGYRYADRDWTALGQAMNSLAERHGIRWLVATSRRSGGIAERLLRDSLSPSLVADAAWYENDKRSVVKGYLGAASRVFCTEDSMSMLGEAAAAGRPVYALAPGDAMPQGRNAIILDRLMGEGRVHRLAIDGLVETETLPAREDFTLLEHSPLDDLADQLRPVLTEFTS